MIPNEQLGESLLVVFDGQCGMCNGLVRWLVRLDRHDRLRLAPSNSQTATALLNRHGLAAETLANTIMVALAFASPQEKVLQRSTAVVAILRTLPQPWPWLGTALKCVPRPSRDLGYRLVARLRYRIWGGSQSCPLPSAAERRRFL